MKIKWSLDINTGAVERSEAARALRLAGATVVGPVTARADQLWHAETGDGKNSTPYEAGLYSNGNQSINL